MKERKAEEAKKLAEKSGSAGTNGTTSTGAEGGDIETGIGDDGEVLKWLKTLGMEQYYTVLKEKGFNTLADCKGFAYFKDEAFNILGITDQTHIETLRTKASELEVTWSDMPDKSKRQVPAAAMNMAGALF